MIDWTKLESISGLREDTTEEDLRRGSQVCSPTRRLEREGVEERASPQPSPPSSRLRPVRPHQPSLLLDQVSTTKTTARTVGLRRRRFNQPSPFPSRLLELDDPGTSVSRRSPPIPQVEEATSQLRRTEPPTRHLPFSLQEPTPPLPPALPPSLPSPSIPIPTQRSTPLPTANPKPLPLLTRLTPLPIPTPQPQPPPPSLPPHDASPPEPKLEISSRQLRSPSSIDQLRVTRRFPSLLSLLPTERSSRSRGSLREERSRREFRRR